MRVLFPCLVFAALAVAGCGGGGGGTAPAMPAPGPSASIQPGPSPASVTLAGGGYTLFFFVPKETTGSTSTMTATLSTTLPNGVLAPSSLHRAPSTIGTTTTGLVYLTVSSTAQVGFSSAPSFVFTVPSGTTIPAGNPAYLLFWDPGSYAGGWVALLGPATQSGTTVSFPGVATGVTLKANTPYIYALAYTAQAVPTATPAPSPTPTPGPTPTPTGAPSSSPVPLAAYCGSYSSIAGVPLNITDDSALGAVLIVYVSNGTSFMDNTGAFTQSTAYPLPAACFSTTVGSSATNKSLSVPSTAGSGRVYFAYATPNPNPAIVPNPFGSASVSGPNVGYATSPYPWDKIEFGTTAGATIDTTQVDALGLPLELSVTGGALPQASTRSAMAFPAPCATSAPGIVGVTSCNYANIFQVMSGIPEYNNLVVTQNFNGKLIDLQIVAPKDSVAFTSFQWNIFGLPAYVPSPQPAFCPGTPAIGYLSCLLSAYNTTLAQGRLFGTNGIGASNVSGHNYCATSDGSSNFVFTDVGSATLCASATPNPNPALAVNPFKMPVQELNYGVPPGSDGGGACKQAILFSQPWGNANVGAGHIFAGADAFALWKDLTADINRGTMLSTTQMHPVGLTSPSMSLFFQDPMFNSYDQVMHTYFNGNLAYGIAYDDLGGFESGVIWQPGQSFNVRINAIPAALSASTAPSPVAVPIPCPNLPINVGTF